MTIQFLKANIPEHLWPEGYLTNASIETMQAALLERIALLEQAVEKLEGEKVKDGWDENF